MAKLQLTMVTAERRLLDETADMVIAPGGGGELGILPRHQPLITTLKPGELRVREGGEETLYVVAGGFLEVRHAQVDGAPGSQVIVLADAAERAEDIDLERARAAAQRAQDALARRRCCGRLPGSGSASDADTGANLVVQVGMGLRQGQHVACVLPSPGTGPRAPRSTSPFPDERCLRLLPEHPPPSDTPARTAPASTRYLGHVGGDTVGTVHVRADIERQVVRQRIPYLPPDRQR